MIPLHHYTTPIIVSPTLYTFPCFTNPEWVSFMKPQTGIEKWSWHSCQELKIACLHALCKKTEGVGMDEEIAASFHLSRYTALNRNHGKEDANITWFLAYETGFLFRKHDSQFCPWSDPALYIPAKWGMRIMAAAERGVMELTWTDTHVLEATFWGKAEKQNLACLVNSN